MRRTLTILVAGLLLVLLGAGSAWAEGAANSTTVVLKGQAVLVRNGDAPQLLFSTTASDGSGWRLDVTMTPNGQTLSTQGKPVVTLTGTYQLSSPTVSLVSGTANGQLNQDGSGQVQLLNATGNSTTAAATPLTATFNVAQSGDIVVTMTGTLPSPPPPPTAQPVNHTFWYIARAAGFTAYGLLTLTVCFGLLVHTKIMDAIVARWQTFDLHQVTALLALGFVGLHIFALLGDQYIGFNLPQLFVPFLASYRPTEVAIGVVAMYLLIVVVGSFYVRQDIGYATWRAIHYTTFGVFLLALGHGVLAGTDSSTTWARWIYWGTGLLVLVLTIWRINRDASREPRVTVTTVRAQTAAKQPVGTRRVAAKPVQRPAPRSGKI